MNMTDQKPKLIYVGDPMCSWCYGIAEELEQTTKHYKGILDLEIIMGGLIAGGGEEWNSQFKEFLKHHWEDVGMRSGQPFKFDILKWDEFDYDTEPSCRSVVTIQSIDPDKALLFFKEVQKGFYLKNKDPKLVDFYKDICTRFNIDFELFKSKFDSDEMKAATQQHFQRSQQMGVRSFPTILIEHNGQLHLVASGYSTFEKMREQIDKIIL
jgi:putative protein-disulfide isomerase